MNWKYGELHCIITTSILHYYTFGFILFLVFFFFFFCLFPQGPIFTESEAFLSYIETAYSQKIWRVSEWSYKNLAYETTICKSNKFENFKTQLFWKRKFLWMPKACLKNLVHKSMAQMNIWKYSWLSPKVYYYCFKTGISRKDMR